MNRCAHMIISSKDKKCKVDPRLFGSFVEHMGRAVYTGLYEPGHKEADENGFRQDVLDLVKPLRIPIYRYPGGAYASSYYWEDSVGPTENRKKRMECSWQCIEPNTFGVEEFALWTEKTQSQIMMTLNLATRGIQDALNQLEYCNMDTDTYYAELRRQHGRDKPYGIKTWCLGNELGAPYELGQKTAEEYGRLANQTAKAMKSMDPSIETVACGSPFMTCPSYPEWDYTVLKEAYDNIDYIGIHQYFGHIRGSTGDYLASVQDLENYIRTIEAAIDYVKTLKKTDKDVKISFDEWNVWKYYDNIEPEMAKIQRWATAPSLLECEYTLEDAVMVGLFMITFLKHADRIAIAAQAQIANVIGLIMTEPKGKAWAQTIYYPFMLTSQNGRGEVLQSIFSTTKHNTEGHSDVNDIESVAVLSEDGGQVTIFAANTSEKDDVEFTADMLNFEEYEVREFLTVSGEDPMITAVGDSDGCMPRSRRDYEYQNGTFKAMMAPCSWNMVAFKRKGEMMGGKRC